MREEPFKQVKIFFLPIHLEKYNLLEALGLSLSKDIRFIDVISPVGSLEFAQENIELEDLPIIIGIGYKGEKVIYKDLTNLAREILGISSEWFGEEIIS